jgi:Domain of unknown function (DUF4190)/Septum formation
VGLRFNPPPDWPQVPAGFAPPPGWQPDPAWPPVPAGWDLWVPDDGGPARTQAAPFPGPEDDPPTDPLLGGQLPYSQLSWSDLLTRRGPHRGSGRWRASAGTGTQLAIAALALGLAGFLLLTGVASVLAGLAALARIRDDPQPGRGLAVAGIVLSGLWAAVIAVAVGISSGGSPPRPAAAHIDRAQPVAVLSLGAGACFRTPAGSTAATAAGYVLPVPCTQRHGGQVISTFPVAGQRYPAATSLARHASQDCPASIAGKVDTALVTATMSTRYLYPDQRSWGAGYRSIACLMVDSAADMTSSLLGQTVAG